MPNIGIIKRGDTFAFTVEIFDLNPQEMAPMGAIHLLSEPLSVPENLPLTGKAGNLKCQGRYTPNGRLILDMAVREASPGLYELKTYDTKALSVGVSVYFDIEYTDGDVTVSSETFSTTVEGDITYG